MAGESNQKPSHSAIQHRAKFARPVAIANPWSGLPGRAESLAPLAPTSPAQIFQSLAEMESDDEFEARRSGVQGLKLWGFGCVIWSVHKKPP